MVGRFVLAETKQFQNSFKTVLLQFRFSFTSTVRAVLRDCMILRDRFRNDENRVVWMGVELVRG